jgi:hypothetical protein
MLDLIHPCPHRHALTLHQEEPANANLSISWDPPGMGITNAPVKNGTRTVDYCVPFFVIFE